MSMKKYLSKKLRRSIRRSAAILMGALLSAGAAGEVMAENLWDLIVDTSGEAADPAPAQAAEGQITAVDPAAVQSAEGQITTVDPAAAPAEASDLSVAYQIYSDKLNEYGESIRAYSWQSPAKPVCLQDITGDGIPELFFLEGRPEGAVYTATLHIGTVVGGQYVEPAYFPADGGQFHHLSPGGGYHCFTLASGQNGDLLIFSAEGDADYAYEIWQIGAPLGGQASAIQHVTLCDWRGEWTLNDAACTKEEAEFAAANLYAAALDVILYSRVEVFGNQGLLNMSGQCKAGTIDEIMTVLQQQTAAEPGAQSGAADPGLLSGMAPESPAGTAGSLSEDQLRQALASSGMDMGRLQYFLYDDYDGDGRCEAYAVFCDLTGSLEIQNFAKNMSVWFISSDGNVTDMSSLNTDENQPGYMNNGGFIYVPGMYDLGGAAPNSTAAEVLGQIGTHKFFTIECYYMGSGGTSYIFGVHGGLPYQPELSGKSDFFGIENGVAHATAHDFSAGYHQYLTVTYQLDEGTGEFFEVSREALF